MRVGWLIFSVFVLSFILTAALRKYALTNSLMDIPNQRSSHSVPTPRGGGVAIVISFLFAYATLAWVGNLPLGTVLAGIGGGGVVAIIGFMDDHGHIAARWRLLGHAAAAIWILLCMGGMAPITVFDATIDLGWLGQVLAVFYLVWMLNLYNFMDGIDGIASVEAVIVCLGACLLYWLGGVESQAAWVPLMLAAAVGGFLCWNAPPAKIFMGDAGSGFLGIILGLLSLQSTWIGSGFIWMWVILLGVFIVDATFTLFRRMIRGEKVYEAHRSHAYQFASRRFGSHLPVTAGVALINVFWLFPIAYLVVSSVIAGITGVLIAYAPLLLLALFFRAGTSENQEQSK